MKIPTDIDGRFGPRSEEEVNRRIEAWAKKTLQFLEKKPKCSDCGDALYHFSYTMLCDDCRPRKNYRAFVRRNPGYNAQQWQKNKVRKLKQQRRYYLANKDEINRQRRIRRREKRRNYEESLRFKLGKLEKDVQDAGLIYQAPT